jgi:serine phosphatase RsbU (regulator of sigma subunit)/pSer/pThr/pTyr-binding forkhead associated (FHA) protein
MGSLQAALSVGIIFTPHRGAVYIVVVLEVLKGTKPGQLIQVQSDRTVFGRHPHCQLVLENAAVSRYHAQVIDVHGDYYIEDLRSRNGTHVNDELVEGRRKLQDKDVIRVCDFSFRFVENAPTDSALLKPGPVKGKVDVIVGPVSLIDSAVRPTMVESEEDNGNKPSAIKFDEGPGDSSSIISTLDAGSSSSDLRLSVKPETKLKAILEISKTLSRAANLDQVLDKTLDGLFRIFSQADEGFIMLRDQEKNKLVVKATKSRRKSNGEDQVHVSMTIVRKALDSSEGILSANVQEDPLLKSSESLPSLRIRSMICAPMLSKELGPLGVIQITTTNVGAQLRHEDLDLLISVAMQVGLAVENAYLHHQTLLQRDMERDLEFATQVQLGFLPKSRPKLPGYAFSDYYEPAQRVGGDYFDYIQLPDGRLAVALADVAGKGVPAALLMARLYSSVRFHLLSHADLNMAMSGLNSEIAVSGLGHRFITCVLMVIDPVKNQLTLVNAGHLPPLRRDSSGQVEAIGASVSGLPLGILPNQTFQQTMFSLTPGESWLVFTDGVTEAMRVPQEIYGNKRLMKFLETGPAKIDALVKAVVDDVEAYVEGQAQSDDICLVGFQRLS